MDLLDEGDKAPSNNCFRLVVLGSAKVGKTAVVSRFLHNKYTDSYTPTIEDFHRKVYKIRGEAYRLDILDTSGNNPFPAMRRLCLMTGDLFVIVFSYDNPASFTEVLLLREQIIESKLQMTNEQKKKRKLTNPAIVIVGNKCELTDKAVDMFEIKHIVDRLPSCHFVEASAKKDINIDEVFVKLFAQAKLPTEMSPSLHRRVQPNYVSSNGGKPGRSKVSIRRKLSDACGTVYPNARRPSIRTDLLMTRTGTHESFDKVEQREASTSSLRCILM